MEGADYGLKQQHLNAMKALVAFDNICKREGIRYFLVAGSVLGGVRHGGFIPWDDDIDIGISHSDGRLLEDVLIKQLPKEYQYKSFYTDEKYPRMHAKILCDGKTCIDVFPFINVPDNEVLARFQWFVRRLTEKLYYRKIRYVHDGESDAIVRLSGAVSKLITRRNVIRISEWNCRLFENKKTKRCINVYSIYRRKKETIPAEWLEKLDSVEFEGSQFPTVSHKKEYLTHLYGDWQTPPPLDKRKPAHEELF